VQILSKQRELWKTQAPVLVLEQAPEQAPGPVQALVRELAQAQALVQVQAQVRALEPEPEPDGCS
jgi:hypothetical protein